MNGIEILASEEVAIAWETWNWIAFWVVVATFFILGLILGLAFGMQEADFGVFLSVFLTTFLVGSAIFGPTAGFGIHGTPTEYETQYKVTISDEVNFNEFTEQYEIIDQEGKIYTVRERG